MDLSNVHLSNDLSKYSHLTGCLLALANHVCTAGALKDYIATYSIYCLPVLIGTASHQIEHALLCQIPVEIY